MTRGESNTTRILNFHSLLQIYETLLLSFWWLIWETFITWNTYEQTRVSLSWTESTLVRRAFLFWGEGNWYILIDYSMILIDEALLLLELWLLNDMCGCSSPMSSFELGISVVVVANVHRLICFIARFRLWWW